MNVGLPREVEWSGERVRTSIFNAPVAGPVRVGPLDLEGDAQSDLASAIAFAVERRSWWSPGIG